MPIFAHGTTTTRSTNMNATARILVVEDEQDILELVSYNLLREGYTVDGVTSGEEALRRVATQRPDAVLLDLMLPGMDGLAVCRALRASADTRDIPILMLTAKSEEADIIAGLELGADDYVTKPFSRKVLLARIAAVLRRSGPQGGEDAQALLTAHDIEIDPVRYSVRVDGVLADLTLTEFRILHFLARRPGWVFTRAQIVEAVRGDDYPVTDRSVDVQIVGLRRKLGTAGASIETVRGVGYRMTE
jgi:two-component system, OmpR family, alkaline phosphatase synthesis response regulator PhoP